MITAILLAAGQSKRIPKENKLLKNFRGKILINHILNQLIKSKIRRIVIVLGHEHSLVKKAIIKNKKIQFTLNKNYKSGIASSIKTGIKKMNKFSKGFLIVQSDMPYIKKTHINKIYNSIDKKDNLVHLLKYKNKIGNPIGFNSSVISKFKKIKGDVGAKFMVKRLRKDAAIIKVKSQKIFKDLDKLTDF
jgi:molybdenum cofactor cytidylyltransferase